jgi:Immunity protein 63
MLNLSELKESIEQLALRINAPMRLLPTYGSSRHDGTPHIESNNALYYYINFDRNLTVFNRSTSKLDELLYWVFQDITFYMASDYELAHRDSKVNSRKAIFDNQLKLLASLNPAWREQREHEITEILKAHPYE